MGFRTIILFLILCLSFSLSSHAENPGVEKIEAVCIEGKTYITFKKVGAFEGNYLVYRFVAIPNKLIELKPIVKLPNLTHEHPDNHIAFYLPDGRLLTPLDGLFVYTPKLKESVFYCVMPEGNNDPLVVGKNITEKAIEEVPSEKPSAVFQIQKKIYNQLEDYYSIWMDYDVWEASNSPGQWPTKINEYYGSFFCISYLAGEQPNEKLPVIISLHALSGGGNGGYFALTGKKGFYRIYLADHRKRWWEGSAANRINNSIDFLINNPKYNIDINRIYLEGTSMGGHGAIFHALKFPDKYAAVYSQVPTINPEQISLIKRELDIPPVLSYFGFKDGAGSAYNFGKKGHAPFIQKMQENQFGIWSLWLDEAHAVPKDMNSEKSVAGGYLRFKKNEVYPVFFNTSTDDNCGQKGEINISSAGQVNQKIDWSSSLHPFDLGESKLLDTSDQLSISFKAIDACVTDLTFRRVQNFIIQTGKKISYKNIEIVSGKVLQSGEIIAPADKLFIIKGIQMTTIGNKVILNVVP